jgi:putative addiction module component (TIGR02574 family)
MDSELLLKEALELRPVERLKLIESLAASLDKPDEKIEQIWAEECEKRYQALKDGKVKSIAIEEIRKRYK